MYAKSELKLLCRIDCDASGQLMLGRRLADEDFRTTCMGVLSASVCRYGSECGVVQLRRLLNRLGCSVGSPRCNWSQRAGTSETCVCDCMCAEQVDISSPTEHMRYTHYSCMCRSITEALSSADYKELIGQCSSLCHRASRGAGPGLTEGLSPIGVRHHHIAEHRVECYCTLQKQRPGTAAGGCMPRPSSSQCFL